MVRTTLHSTNRVETSIQLPHDEESMSAVLLCNKGALSSRGGENFTTSQTQRGLLPPAAILGLNILLDVLSLFYVTEDTKVTKTRRRRPRRTQSNHLVPCSTTRFDHVVSSLFLQEKVKKRRKNTKNTHKAPGRRVKERFQVARGAPSFSRAAASFSRVTHGSPLSLYHSTHFTTLLSFLRHFNRVSFLPWCTVRVCCFSHG